MKTKSDFEIRSEISVNLKNSQIKNDFLCDAKILRQNVFKFIGSNVWNFSMGPSKNFPWMKKFNSIQYKLDIFGWQNAEKQKKSWRPKKGLHFRQKSL